MAELYDDAKLKRTHGQHVILLYDWSFFSKSKNSRCNVAAVADETDCLCHDPVFMMILFASG